jgi:hypothetical protein
MNNKTKNVRKSRRDLNRETTTHHRKPVSIGGAINDPRNKSSVERGKHDAWHKLFACKEARTICEIINAKFLDPDYEFVCIKKDNIHGCGKPPKKFVKVFGTIDYDERPRRDLSRIINFSVDERAIVGSSVKIDNSIVFVNGFVLRSKCLRKQVINSKRVVKVWN